VLLLGTAVKTKDASVDSIDNDVFEMMWALFILRLYAHSYDEKKLKIIQK